MDKELQSPANLSDFIGKPVSLQSGLRYAQGSFDIVLM